LQLFFFYLVSNVRTPFVHCVVDGWAPKGQLLLQTKIHACRPDVTSLEQMRVYVKPTWSTQLPTIISRGMITDA